LPFGPVHVLRIRLGLPCRRVQLPYILRLFASVGAGPRARPCMQWTDPIRHEPTPPYPATNMGIRGQIWRQIWRQIWGQANFSPGDVISHRSDAITFIIIGLTIFSGAVIVINVKYAKHCYILLCLLIALLALPLTAQRNRLKFDTIALEQGLSQNSVYAVLQDKRGLMWFGTEDGLNCFDGVSFTVFKPDDQTAAGISDGFISALLEDAAGNLWIGTGTGGLNCFNSATFKFKRYNFDSTDPHSLSNNRVTVLSLNPDQPYYIWVGTQGGGLNRLDTRGVHGTFTRFQHDKKDPKSLSNDHIFCLYQDKSGNLWIGTLGGGINLYNPQDGSFTHIRHNPDNPDSLADNSVYAIYRDHDGGLWVGTDQGLDYTVPGSGKFIHYTYTVGIRGGLNSNPVRAIFQDSLGQLWIGTMGGGLNIFYPKTNYFHNFKTDILDPYSIRGNEIWTIYEDRNRVLWIGTDGSGINKLDLEGKPFLHYRVDPWKSDGLSSNDVWAIYESHVMPGHIWIGTRGGGLNRLEKKTDRFTCFRNEPDQINSLSSDIVYSLLEDKAGTLWVGTDGGGLNRWEGGNNFTHFIADSTSNHAVSSNFVWVLFEDDRKNFWIGTNGGGLNKMDRNSSQFTHYKHQTADTEGAADSISSNNIWAIYQDRNNQLWVGTENGLNLINPQNGHFTRFLKNEKDKSSISQNQVLCMYEDRAGTFWVGTLGGGLNKMDRQTGTFTHYTEKNGLANNVVYGILEERPVHQNAPNYLWLSTNKGLARFQPQSEEFKNFTVRDGLQSNEFNGGSYHKGADGTMYFGGMNGLNIFNPHKINNNPYPPTMMLTGFKLFNKDVQPGETVNGRVILPRSIWETEALTLSYKDSVFSISFAALHYTSPSRNNYAYKMEGIDQSWNHVGNRQFATYTGLPPGDYIFKVKGTNNDGLWCATPRQLVITITPPFHQTWWFRIIAILLAAGLTFVFFKRRVGNIESQKRKLEYLVNIRTHELLEKKDQLEQINNIVKSINSEVELVSLLKSILKETYGSNAASETIALVFDKTSNAFKLKSTGMTDQYTEDTPLTKAEVEERYIIGAQEIVQDIFRTAHSGLPGTRDARLNLIIRVMVENDVFGYLIYAGIKESHFNDNQGIQLLNNLKDHITSAFIKSNLLTELQTANQKLEILSKIDGLTEIANRRHFDNVLQKSWGLCRRNNTPITVLIIDVDFFKRFNDTYGHQRGDICLKAIGALLAHTVYRVGDLCARYGGEEFAVILQDTGEKGGLTVARKILDRVRIMNMPHESSDAAHHVSVSIGVASIMPKNDEGYVQLLKNADDALYRAKAGGRNRVEC